MRALICDLCKENIETDERYYEKPKNSTIAMLTLYDGAALESSELHICTGCFAKVKRIINETIPQLLRDFYLHNVGGKP